MENDLLDIARDSLETIENIYSYPGTCKSISKYPSKIDFIHDNYIDLIRMVQNPKYMSNEYDGPLYEVHECINHVLPIDADDIPDIKPGLGDDIEDMVKHLAHYMLTETRPTYTEKEIVKKVSDISECMMAYISLGLWVYDKQVFAFSDELIKEFMEFSTQENSGIPIRLFKNIPFKSICIDISESHITTKDGIEIGYIIVSPFFVGNDFYYVSIMCARNNFMIINNKSAMVINYKITKFKNWNQDPNAEISLRNFSFDNKADRLITMIGLNCLAYLVSSKPDIEEDLVQKKIYRPSSSIKNKLREIRLWDVGFRYADSIKKQYIQKDTGEEREYGKSSSKRPHVRKAHWHRYWVGHGKNKHLELRWVSSCHINADFISDLPIVSHKEG